MTKSYLKHIEEIGLNIGLNRDDLITYGKYKAKISPLAIDKLKNKKSGKLILVTATNPTPAGEGKTTISIGLADALNKINKKAIVALREPSLGPVFGMKGGATGGGKASVEPSSDINLHFTGDMHAITSANNLLCAIIDNHIFHGNELNIDPRRITINRVIDMNDRSLRNITIGLGGVLNGIPREDHFSITVASEIMAALCLALDYNDLKKRLSNIIIGFTYDKKEIYLKDLKIVDALMDLLKDAVNPNLVQTKEQTPAIIHGGPFANIAHGCSSVIATKASLKLADYCVTEAGFGSDLGAEKFLDIKCRQAGLTPDAIVIVSTIRSLKYNAGITMENIADENIDAVKNGLSNLIIHIENMQKYKVPVVVALNKRDNEDTDAEIDIVKNACKNKNVDFEVSSAFSEGGKGSVSLAKAVVNACEKENNFRFLYDLNLSPKEKIQTIAKEIYRARSVNYSKKANNKLNSLESVFLKLPVCIAKTQYSLSDDPKLLGAKAKNKDYDINVTDISVCSGAAFIVVYCGSIMTMPGLPKKPSAITSYMDKKDL